MIKEALANGRSYVKSDTSSPSHVDETISTNEMNKEEVVFNVLGRKEIDELKSECKSEDLNSARLEFNYIQQLGMQ